MMNLTISQLNKIWQDASTTVGGFLLADSEHPIEFHLGYDNGQRCFIVMNSGKVDDKGERENIRSDKMSFCIFYHLPAALFCPGGEWI